MVDIEIIQNPVDGRVIVNSISGMIPGQAVRLTFQELQDDGSTLKRMWILTRVGTEHFVRELTVEK